MKNKNFDKIWEKKYSKGHIEKYPWDIVITFVNRNIKKNIKKSKIKILEIGCGTGNNVWFMAREGYSTYGIDISKSAIKVAKKRLKRDGLRAKLRVCNFVNLPFDDNFFDLVIDRASLTTVNISVAEQSIAEIERVIKPGGKFFFNPYSSKCTSAISGKLNKGGLVKNIKKGTLVEVGQIYFYNYKNLQKVLRNWHLISVKHAEEREYNSKSPIRHAEWRVVAKCKKKELNLKKLSYLDKKKLFKWRNNKFFISRSISKRAVSWKEHSYWFNSVLNSKNNLLYIIFYQKKAIGHLRFGKISLKFCVVSIYILPRYIKQGLGYQSLLNGRRKVKKKWKNISIIANVLKNNTSGISFFKKANFKINNKKKFRNKFEMISS